MSQATRTSKLRPLDEVVGWVTTGAHVAFGGFLIHNKPAAFVRELARQGTGELHLYSCPTASYDADVLIGAGLVTRTVLGNVSFDYLGRAPRFTTAAAASSIDVEVCDEAIVAGGYMATIEGIPYHPLHSARGHDVAKGSRLLTPYRAHTGHDLVAVSPLAPDVAVLHVQQADSNGNGRHLGSLWGDELLAKAAGRVVLTCDELVGVDVIRSNPKATTIPGHLVDAVVHVPHGAHPCSSHGRYLFDVDHLRAYLDAAETQEGFDTYAATYIHGGDQEHYLRLVGAERPLAELEHRFPWA